MTCSMGWWHNMIGHDRKKRAKPLAYTPDEDEYIVREGDTPESIAKEMLDDPAAYPLILSYNGIFREDIVPGAKIYFPKNKE